MGNVRWYAVRCCCQPQKVIGFMRLYNAPLDYVLVREVETLRTSSAVIGDANIPGPVAITPTHRIEIRTFNDHGVKEPAIYSDDRPIEFWRRIRGFVEVKNDG